MRNKLRKILSHSVVFVIGMCAAIVVTVYAATYSSSDVGYTNNSQTTVEGALDDLYTKINEQKEFGIMTPQITFNSTGKLFWDNTETLCVVAKNGKVYCAKKTDSKATVASRYPEIICKVRSSLGCNAAHIAYQCEQLCKLNGDLLFVGTSSGTEAYDQSDGSMCAISTSTGTVTCE